MENCGNLSPLKVVQKLKYVLVVILNHLDAVSSSLVFPVTISLVAVLLLCQSVTSWIHCRWLYIFKILLFRLFLKGSPKTLWLLFLVVTDGVAACLVTWVAAWAATCLVACVAACVATYENSMEFLSVCFAFADVQIQMNRRYLGFELQLDSSFQRNCGIHLMSPPPKN